jgi:hypothetical protein
LSRFSGYPDTLLSADRDHASGTADYAAPIRCRATNNTDAEFPPATNQSEAFAKAVCGLETQLEPSSNGRDIRSLLVYNCLEDVLAAITMPQTLREMLSSKDSLAKAFWRLGWAGVWIQIVIGSIPVLLAIYALIFGRSPGAGTRGGSLLIECLAIAGLILMVFTTIWSYRYTRLGKQIADPARRPSEFEIRRVAWIGVAASAVSILFSMLVILFEVVQLLIYFLRAPQAGVPAVQTTGGGQASWVSAADMMSLLALTVSLFGELTILVFSIWLLFRSMMASSEFPHVGNEE